MRRQRQDRWGQGDDARLVGDHQFFTTVISGEGGDDKIAGGEGNDAEIIGDHRAANPSGAAATTICSAMRQRRPAQLADGIDSGNGEDDATAASTPTPRRTARRRSASLSSEPRV